MTLIFGGVKENLQVPGEAVEEGSTLMVITYQVSVFSPHTVCNTILIYLCRTGEILYFLFESLDKKGK